MLLWGEKNSEKKTIKDAGVIEEGENKDTLAAALNKIRRQCGQHVANTMAMYKLMHAQQDSETFTQFARELDDLDKQC